jgi:ankyrin repeat protein
MILLSTGIALLLIQAPPLDEELLEAARKGDLPAVQALVGKGANIEAQSRYGQTPLFFAARNGHAPVVRFLLGKGAKTDVKDSFYKMSLLSAAADRGGVDVVAALLDAGANGSDALGMAVYRGNKEIVELILRKAKPPADELSSALQAAEQAKQPEIAAMLKAAGAKPPRKPEAVVAAEKLALLVGTYKGDPVGEFTVQLKEGKLFAMTQGQSFELGAFDETTFGLVQAPQVTLKFNVEGGKATKLILDQRGAQFTLVRVEEK